MPASGPKRRAWRILFGGMLLSLIVQMPVRAATLPWSDLPRRFTDLLSHKPADPSPPSRQGMHPSGELLQASDGMYYGVTMFGGINNTGTVYRLDTKRHGGFTTLYSFPKLDGSGHNQNGAYPIGALVEDASNPGTLYGAAFQGGRNGNGTLYKVTTAGTANLLHTFGAVDGSGSNSDGSLPIGGLIQAADGNFYGCAAHGGTEGNGGTVFKMTPSGAYSVLHTFSGTDGRIPMGLLEDSVHHGVFYGTTETGGPTTKNGTVFKVAAGKFTTIHTFADANTSNPGFTEGVNPGAGLTQSRDGTYFVGTTRHGGYYGGGTAYKVTRNGTVTILTAFEKPDSYGASLHGSQPEALLAEDSQNAGRFYGTTPFGGSYGHGVIFKVFAVYPAMPAGSVAFPDIAPFHMFDGTEGDKPYFGLIRSTDNLFYGIAPYGGGYTPGNYINNGSSFSFNSANSSFQTISHVSSP